MIRARDIILALCVVWALSGAVSPAAAVDWPEIELIQVHAGFSRPVEMIHAGDGSGRLFVVEQTGRIRVIEGGEIVETPFLDISEKVKCCGESGLLGLAFPPGFSVKRYFYVNYTDTGGDTVVARYHLSGNDKLADAASEEIILTIDQPFGNHNGGKLAFGPDGYLYIGTGDGGSAGDPDNQAQNRLSLLGKMLRIDVESGQSPYSVPPSNPFADLDDAQPEIWALGLRNPWRFSFDRETGDLYIGDVGQDSFEEVNVQLASSAGGENYGWKILEASTCFNQTECDTTGLVMPVAEYSHSLGCSVTGGQVPRSGRWPRLDGTYLYGDYCSGRIWGLRRSLHGWESAELAETGISISAFGIDEEGSVYVLSLSPGRVYAVTDGGEQSVHRQLVPAVAHIRGRGGIPWRTDLAAANPLGSQTDLTLSFRGDGHEVGRTVQLGPGAAVEWRNVLVSLFDLADTVNTSGVVEILSNGPVSITARSYADLEDGTLGQYLPGLAWEDGIGPGELGVLPQLSRNSERYVNIGAVNLGEMQCRVAVRLRDAEGAQLGEALIFELEPGEWDQLTDVLDGLGDRDVASATVEVLTPGCRAWAYASLVDRDSRDPTTILMQTTGSA
jgi:glucose/arabinose dehydrogenase